MLGLVASARSVMILGCCMAGYGPVELVLNHLDELLGALELGIAVDGECIDIADLLVEALL